MSLKQSQVGGRIFGGILLLFGVGVLGYDVADGNISTGSLIAGSLFTAAGLGLSVYIGPRHLLLDKENDVVRYQVKRLLWPIDKQFSMTDVNAVQVLTRFTASKRRGNTSGGQRTRPEKRVYYYLSLRSGERIHLVSTRIPVGFKINLGSLSTVSTGTSPDVPQLIRRIAEFVGVDVKVQ